MAGASPEVNWIMRQGLGCENQGLRSSTDQSKSKGKNRGVVVVNSDRAGNQDMPYMSAVYNGTGQRKRNRHSRDTEVCDYFAERCSISRTICHDIL